MFLNQALKSLRQGWAVGIFAAGLAYGQYTQSVGEAGNVDWSQQKIRATGIGAPNADAPNTGVARANAIRAAKEDAFRNILETAKGVNINSETTVRNAMVESDIIRSKVEGVLRGFTVVDTRYMSDQSIEVEIEVPLSGVLSDALLPQNFGGGQLASAQPLCPMCGQPWPQGKPVPPGTQLVYPGTGSQVGMGTTGGAYTGLIIDAKGLGVMPAMAPKVVDENGNEVYGSKYVSRDFAVKQGMVGYDKDVNAARNNQRVTNNPLIIKAVKSSGNNKTDIVVANADAQRIHSAAQTQNFLDKCRVMLILD
jgi:hypothetical protein